VTVYDQKSPRFVHNAPRFGEKSPRFVHNAPRFGEKSPKITGTVLVIISFATIKLPNYLDEK
jgi:hypothetical protein